MLHLFEAFGVELEYMLVDAARLGVAPQADWLLADAAGDVTGEVVRGGYAWNNELALHVIEVNLARPAPRLDGVAAGFQAEVAEMNRRLDARGLRLMPTGMHPWMDPATESRTWPHQNREVYEAFDRIFGCRGHGWTNLQSMHLNLPFAGDAEFVRLHTAIRFLLPALPALTASSPAMDGRLTGLADNRLAVYRDNCARVPSITGRVVPEPVAGIAEYREQVLGRIYRDLAPLDPQGVLAGEWVNARGAIARFDRMAIEIRVLDVQECPAMDLAFAALVVATLQALCREEWAPVGTLAEFRTADLAAGLGAATATAERTEVHDAAWLRALGFLRTSGTLRQLWAHLAERAAAAGALDAATERLLERYLREGSLATRIVSRLPAEPTRADLARVYRELCDHLAAGRPWFRDA